MPPITTGPSGSTGPSTGPQDGGPQDDGPRTPRAVADAYVDELVELDPLVATSLGRRPGDDRAPDLSPQAQDAKDDAARRALGRLAAAEAAGAAEDPLEARAARLLRERLEAQLAVSAAGEHLRQVRNIFGPPQAVRQLFSMMPARTPEDWAVIARRMSRVDESFAGYVESLRAGGRRGLYAAPRQVRTLADQLGDWLEAAGGRGWFTGFVEEAPADLPASLRSDLTRAAESANRATADLRGVLLHEYLPATEGTPDAVGAERYRLLARLSTGADLDLEEAYRWGWQEYLRLDAEIREEAERVLPGATPLEAMRHLDAEGEAVEGVEAVRERLQQMLDGAVADLDGTHFDIADPVKVVEARIAPPGSAAAPYYTRPTLDFSRPGRTWLPTLGQNRFPLWNLVSTWYHEGVPGHHLQLAQWAYVAPQLSTYQTTVGSVSANTEGWALYAERLMDELGYLADPGARLGYLDAQMMRAVRVVIDIGMHLRLSVPEDSTFHPGETWTPELAREFFGAHSGREAAFIDSEVVRYLGWPGQAISYKLGERAWLAGREEARRRRGDGFDLKAWHMAALSAGSLGLDDLTEVLAGL
ncbi:DUF885 domain-containing protein [Kineosporiaceae bacterium SCSIO 59966]|nr:DUF885 domain-containing protein [Kineosporiaceae bacterium SCSIO 59966]